MVKKNASKTKRQGAGESDSVKEQGERKDHVLQTRVPKSLHADLVEKARRLRVPVSNLVRNILEDSVRMVENIVDSGLDIAEALSGKADDDELSAVVGWQPMLTNRKISCARCAAELAKNDEAFMSVGAPSGRTIVICKECKCQL